MRGPESNRAHHCSVWPHRVTCIGAMSSNFSRALRTESVKTWPNAGGYTDPGTAQAYDVTTVGFSNN
jgi:hypothetical protein